MSHKTNTSRALHIIDAANELGDPFFTVSSAQRLGRAWEACTHPEDADHFIKATGPGTAADLGIGWPGGRLLSRAGKDGADTAIIESIDVAWVKERFDVVYLGTGDHSMQPMAAELLEAGVRVVLVARDKKSVHRDFRSMNKLEIRYLNFDYDLAA